MRISVQPCCWLLTATLCIAAAQDKPIAHFHHVHLNSTNPEAAIDFYTSHFDCKKASYHGEEAISTPNAWLLFNKVSTPAPFEVISAIWHIGWGAEDMPATYRHQLDIGTVFQTPITDISGLTNSPNFFYAYVDGPGHELIELNTSNNHRFGHIHLFSKDPIAAADWYARNFGVFRTGGRSPSHEPRFYKGYQVGPSATVVMDHINIIIFPIEHARQTFPELWKNRTDFATTKGRAIDHIAFSVDDPLATRERLRQAGVEVDSDGFLEGPDGVRIELVQAEAHNAATSPAQTSGTRAQATSAPRR